MFPLVSEDLDDDDLADLATQIAVHYDDMFQLVSEELDANLATQIAVDYDDMFSLVPEDLDDDDLADLAIQIAVNYDDMCDATPSNRGIS